MLIEEGLQEAFAEDAPDIVLAFLFAALLHAFIGTAEDGLCPKAVEGLGWWRGGVGWQLLVGQVMEREQGCIRGAFSGLLLSDFTNGEPVEAGE